MDRRATLSLVTAANGRTEVPDRQNARFLGNKAQHQVTIAAVHFSPRSRVLDLGSGTGGTALHLVRLGHTVRMVEHDPASLSAAEQTINLEKMWGRISTELADAAWFLRQPQDAYDAVICTYLLHFLPADEFYECLRRIMELVKPGGHAVIAAFTKAGPLWTPGQPGYYLDPGELERLFEGWEIYPRESHEVITAIREKDALGGQQHHTVACITAKKPELPRIVS